MTTAPATPRRSAGRSGASLAGSIAGAAAALLLLGGSAASGETFKVDGEATRLTIHVYREGIGSVLAHDHVVEATQVSGTVEYDAARPDASAVAMEARTDTLRIDDPLARRRLGVEGDLSESQRADVAKAMRSVEQLDVGRYPTVRFVSTRVVAESDGRLRITGELTLRGVTREVTFPALVTLDRGVLRGRASLRFLQSSFGYRPYTALLGAIRNKDEVGLDVELVARP